MELDSPPPPAPATDMNDPAPDHVADMEKAMMRQFKVINMLKDQIGNVVLNNVEQAAQMEEMRAEIQALRAGTAAPEQP